MTTYFLIQLRMVTARKEKNEELFKPHTSAPRMFHISSKFIQRIRKHKIITFLEEVEMILFKTILLYYRHYFRIITTA